MHRGKTLLLMSVQGLVSRVTPVQTAMRNCTRDEGRSFEVGNQVLISSHRKLLSSKAMVVNVAEKSERVSNFAQKPPCERARLSRLTRCYRCADIQEKQGPSMVQ